MHHLALPFYCAVIVGALMALLARAIYTGAASFVLIALAGIAYFGWHGWNDARRGWPAFRVEMQRRTDERRRRAMPADDTH
ncbi:hypothetical protein C1925_04840 [Stenotrophomonas sp. SAU14A_NAIMI4_5]|uniref:hypothetical protein n=1 Tax=Stenotrophomonas sp. SAU14A_NAIMI4_5 TaxID=2072413 RepID=UPI000D53D9F5|nr:hypothetical protein [Stenotrophomonas sp. SAU14A_NAIMI4_5]AWH48531.1 hypothetical protein C1925_04840 [Stenotrophomonas sp. SAU14A_NAIMI4_5]